MAEKVSNVKKQALKKGSVNAHVKSDINSIKEKMGLTIRKWTENV